MHLEFLCFVLLVYTIDRPIQVGYINAARDHCCAAVQQRIGTISIRNWNFSHDWNLWSLLLLYWLWQHNWSLLKLLLDLKKFLQINRLRYLSQRKWIEDFLDVCGNKFLISLDL
jgi:hypothetical protein